MSNPRRVSPRITNSDAIRSEPAGPMPEAAFQDLYTWFNQALGSGNADHRLLLTGLPDWSIGPLVIPVLVGTESVLCAFKRPKEEEDFTLRVIDPEMLALLKLHFIAGGRITMEPHGPGGGYYYSRCYFPGHGPGDDRRAYVSRLIAGTVPGDRTKEGLDFQNMRRSMIGWRSSTEQESASRYGREDATRWTLDAVEKAPARRQQLADGVTVDRIRGMLEAGYQLLDKLPLGFDHR